MRIRSKSQLIITISRFFSHVLILYQFANNVQPTLIIPNFEFYFSFLQKLREYKAIKLCEGTTYTSLLPLSFSHQENRPLTEDKQPFKVSKPGILQYKCWMRQDLDIFRFCGLTNLVF